MQMVAEVVCISIEGGKTGTRVEVLGSKGHLRREKREPEKGPLHCQSETRREWRHEGQSRRPCPGVSYHGREGGR